ncbi:MAG: hypothetical protein LBD85_00105 [Oscillospiraceae bacterium]|jgi:hypothetical protein|nr:hypothetical protein [Oscillospiraceae bacterium]
MTLNNVKSRLYERVSEYWDGAVVKWGAAPGVKPKSPLVVLRMGTVTRVARPIEQSADGSYIAVYPSETTLQIDLFTRGKRVTASGGAGYYENTAVSDLLRFVNYLDSPATINWLAKNDLSMHLLGGVHDLSEIINDTQWSYRAMCELRIGFTEWAAEYEATLGDDRVEVNEEGDIIKDGAVEFDAEGNPDGVDHTAWEQTASGGGTKELAGKNTGFFTEAEIREVNINGK